MFENDEVRRRCLKCASLADAESISKVLAEIDMDFVNRPDMDVTILEFCNPVSFKFNLCKS